MTNAICDGAQERVSTSDEVDWPFGDIADPETGDTVDEVAPSAQRFVKLPNTALGKLLDNGRASAHAIKLLAIKVSKGTHVLNERAVDKYFGVGRRGFRAGIALLKEAGLLHRVNHGRRFAREKLLDGSGGFVALPACLLTKRADVLAFIAAVLVSPEPMTARKAADRIGVKPKSRNSVYALVKVAEPFIKSSKGPRGVILVARQSHVFEQVADVRKNVLLKNVLLKNVPTHREMEEEHRKKKEVHRETEEDHPSPSRGEGIPPSPVGGGACGGFGALANSEGLEAVEVLSRAWGVQHIGRDEGLGAQPCPLAAPDRAVWRRTGSPLHPALVSAGGRARA